jgi:bla regulator protein blaR1
MMKTEARRQKRTGTTLLLPSLLALIVVISVIPSNSRAASSQSAAEPSESPVPQWQIDAGGKMSFDVASVKEDTVAGQQNRKVNVPFYGDAYSPNGGLFSATNYWLQQYIAFAYKLSLTQAIALELPKWAQEKRFDIQARSAAGITKDQMRLMMQALLADRFQLKAHFETKPTHVYALLLVKPGKTGPNLQPHSDDPPCPDPSAPFMSDAGLISTPKGFPVQCSGPISILTGNGAATFGGRDQSMAALADWFCTAPNFGIDRPVVDQTGLTGKFDFIMKYTSVPTSATNQVPADAGPDLHEALRDQLGLKLDAITAPFETLIIDHIDQPTPN